MAIVKMSEFDLLIRNKDVDALLLALQRYKNVMFKDKVAEVAGFSLYESTYDFEDNADKQNHIQSILKRLDEVKKKAGSKGNLFQDLGLKTMNFNELDQIVSDTDLDNILDMYAEHYESATHLVENFNIHFPWEDADFSTELLKSLENVKPIIGKVPNEHLDELVEVLSELKDIYFMYEPKKEEEASIMVVIPAPIYCDKVYVLVDKYEVELRSSISLHIEKYLEVMKMYLRRTLDKRANMDDRMSRLGLYQEILKAHYEALRNEALREESKQKFLSSEHVTYMSGWVYEEDWEAFEAVVSKVTESVYDLSLEKAEATSPEIPIKLRNNKFVSAFEPITNMYSQPRYDELDPTPLLAPFYAFFFGMMLADVGYGLVMGIVMFLAQKYLNLKKGTKDMVRLLMYVSIPTAFWGLIYGSFFGGIVPMKALVDIGSEYNTILVLALGFGIVHLFYGLAIKGYIYFKNDKKRYIIYDVILWYMTLLGAVVLVSQMFTDVMAPYTTLATIIMVIGMVGIVLTNGRDAKTAGGKAASGLYSLYGLTNYIGDVVSYSRLMALGLSGASIGLAFNMMVDMVSGMGFIGVIFGVFLFIGGHTFNLLISGLSSYVHSARLTYVEFFGKFFVGGGRAFKEFIAKPTYIDLEEE